MFNADELALEIITLLEQARLKMEALRNANAGFDGRQLSIAITDCEASQLRVANARPE